MSLPIRRAQFDVPGFAAWLAKNGAEVGIPTNPYEVVRYRAYSSGSKRPLTHIVYAKETGLLNFQGASSKHYAAFLEGKAVRGLFVSKFDANPFLVEKPEQAGETAGKAEKRRAKLLARDGDECWFCGLAMGEDCTVEHLVPKSGGGPNTLANYALAHAKCNHDAADLPLIQKIAMREKLRRERSPA